MLNVKITCRRAHLSSQPYQQQGSISSKHACFMGKDVRAVYQCIYA